MSLGGPHIVGMRLGIEWKDEKEIFIIDEAKRPRRTETYAFDNTGELRLGKSFEDQLSTAIDIDMKNLKKKLLLKNKENKINKTSEFQRNGNGEDYKQWRMRNSNNIKKKNTYKIIEEYFTLKPLQRLYLAFTIGSNAFVHGRVTKEIIFNHMLGDHENIVMQTITIVSLLSLIGAGISASLCVNEAKMKNRNTLLWLFKGLLGGPVAYFEVNTSDTLVTEIP
jgi:hypothetical protein